MDSGLAETMVYGDGGSNTKKHFYSHSTPNKKRKKRINLAKKRKKVAK